MFVLAVLTEKSAAEKKGKGKHSVGVNPLNIAIDGFIANFHKNNISGHSDPNCLTLHRKSLQGQNLTSKL